MPLCDIQVYSPDFYVLKSGSEERRVSVPAIALNYSIVKGVLPVVGVRDDQTEQDMQALGWRLSVDEIERIEEVSIGQKSRFMHSNN